MDGDGESGGAGQPGAGDASTLPEGPPHAWTFIHHVSSLYSLYLQEWMKVQMSKVCVCPGGGGGLTEVWCLTGWQDGSSLPGWSCGGVTAWLVLWWSVGWLVYCSAFILPSGCERNCLAGPVVECWLVGLLVQPSSYPQVVSETKQGPGWVADWQHICFLTIP